MALAGDTVRLKCHFRTFEGQLVDPVNVKLTIYDANKQQIEQITLTDTNKDNGVYFYDYVLPDDKQEIIFEFRGLYNNEKPILSRGKVKIQFN
ncbi:hypothetical protein [Anoxybacillus flavithermus]|uniref:hypothetical protein n=1 Tax=Anoxybacillus flavithermus TaxID=33934 RepID=UPI001868D499|nr:hypothetical protein [Anoxybacillus flavithermus]MBE2927396.1 hypothetical protein [Anoxybacillus flavithermus]MBE2938802.1 hypothetical protein [Anoxybacillus flavithermus]MBE2946122.1 hypothetical protein [Anoxybacillus flavithermus]MBE2948890.1 hypothetical protein [Anoxybacillus flavithermus]